MPKIAPYGTWISPITEAMSAAPPAPFSGLVLEAGNVFWSEVRPEESARYTVMRRTPDGAILECIPAPFNARTTVHEYGGGAFTVDGNVLYFSNFMDQRLYRLAIGKTPQALTQTEGYRYSDLTLDRRRNRLLCVREDHTGTGEALNTLVSIDLATGGDGTVIASGRDFYSNPRLSPDAAELAFLTWNHPNMPWDGCELFVAPIAADGTLGEPRRLAGGPHTAIFQPEWSPDGLLHYVSDESGWWNLYRLESGSPRRLCDMQADFGKPQWSFGYATYGFGPAGKILCVYAQLGLDHLAWLDPATGAISPIDDSFTDIEFLRCSGDVAAFVGGGYARPFSIVCMDLETARILPFKAAFKMEIGDDFISTPQLVSFPTSGGKQAHALYFPPTNGDYQAPADERPPLIVLSHGGPTSCAVSALTYTIQYWTSRGFAVAEVNYGGSSGHGREYRRRLNGEWGVVDVDDCCNAALYLAERGLADRQRLAIRGGSAGGFCTFACLTFRSEVFGVGAAHFGVSDLETFVADTHKFESHYLETLVGPYPERKDLYLARSPIHFVDNLRCALILFQGDEDKVVPPEQSRLMFEAVRRKGLPTAYLLFPGEQHGFRKAETIKRSLEAELYFYSRIFGFTLPAPVEPVTIENLPATG